jgi:hypothetical protein
MSADERASLSRREIRMTKPLDLKPHPDVVFRRLGERTVLVHLRTNTIFELNPTGTRVWELIQEGLNSSTLLERLSREYDVDRRSLETDVEDLLSSLSAAGLIS